MSRVYPRVVAAAIFDSDTRIIYSLPPPARHHDVLEMMFGQGVRQGAQHESGFLMADGEFYRRRPAWAAAEQNGQLLPRAPTCYGGPGQLFSEDVW